MLSPRVVADYVTMRSRRLVVVWRRLTGARDAVMAEVQVPGARWELELFADGHVEVEIFQSDCGVLSQRRLRSRPPASLR